MFQLSLIVLGLTSVWPSTALAQNGHTHTQQNTELRADQKQSGALIKIVRESTERFMDVSAARGEGYDRYDLLFGCVSGPDAGAMGLHFVNLKLLNDVNKNGVFDATHPQIVIYEPTSDGSLRLLWGWCRASGPVRRPRSPTRWLCN